MRRLLGKKVLTVALVLLGLAGATAQAAAPSYLGRWVITSAQPAPWFDPENPATAPFDDHLIGRAVIYRPTRIDAPRPLACAHPAYRLLEVPPDYLFQGALTAPPAQAAALGFHAATIRTLDTGCAALIDFHFTDDTTALFALNNRIYTLQKR